MRIKILLTLTVLSLALCGCNPPEEIVEVKCLEIHYYGESPAKGTLQEEFNYMTCERVDTNERRRFCLIIAKPGDVFKMNWNASYYE